MSSVRSRLDNKSRHSMSSGTKPGPESDTDSMAEYGEGETGKEPFHNLLNPTVLDIRLKL